MTALEATNTSTLPIVIYERLQSAILNGAFKPGQVLRQEDIATHLGVSRSPVREALSRLEADGIVTSRPHRGYAVVEFEPAQIEEVFDLRCLLESELARRAIRRRTEADISRVYQTVHELSTTPDLTDLASLAKWHDLHTSFHQALLEPSASPHHLNAWRHSYNLIELFTRAESRMTGNVRKPQEEHVKLAQAFALGDEENFVALTRRHSHHTRERLLTQVNQLQR